MEEIEKVLEVKPNPERGKDYAVYIMRLKDGTRAVWKPDIMEYRPSIVALKEIVAYRIDKWLGLNVVPETEFRHLENKPGSLQRFIDGIVGTKALELGSPAINFGDAQKLGLFDYMVNNCDRWPSNFIVDKNGKIWGIDNAGILQERDAWTASSWAITGKPLADELKKVVFKARKEMADLTKTIYGVRFHSWHGEVSGAVLDVGMNIMYEKICCLAGALDYHQSLIETWGCPDWKKLKEEASIS